MDGIMNKNQLAIVKEFDFDKPLIHKIDFIIDNWFRDCHNKYFHTLEHKCVFHNKLTSIGNNGKVNLTIAGKSINLYEVKRKLKTDLQKVSYLIK